MSKRKPQLYFQDILDSILKIEEFTKDFNFDQFQSDEKTIEAVIRKREPSRNSLEKDKNHEKQSTA